MAVLKGDEKTLAGVGSGKVRKSGPSDHVFVYFADHGAPGLIAFPEDEFSAMDLNRTINKHVKRRFLNNCGDLEGSLRSTRDEIVKILGRTQPLRKCDVKLVDEIDIVANFELTQPCHRVQRRNVNFDYEARDNAIEDPTLKYKAEFYFFIR
ncbi:hypothetical protein TNCV_3606411 [Trichonephila clavipes]|nr:hypothetical protein TNCV_3606411 [Trichonephila clavipes]